MPRTLFLGLLAAGIATLAQADLVRGQVLNKGGMPVHGAQISIRWEMRLDGPVSLGRVAVTDFYGAFEYEHNFYGRPGALLALSPDRKSGAIVVVDPAKSQGALEIRLMPLVHVTGEVTHKEAGSAPINRGVSVQLMPGRHMIADSWSDNSEMQLWLPPADYQLLARGEMLLISKIPFTVKPDQPEVRLSSIDLKPTVLRKNIGKPAPPLTVTDARGVSKQVKLSDYKGKWVVLEFWGFW